MALSNKQGWFVAYKARCKGYFSVVLLVLLPWCLEAQTVDLNRSVTFKYKHQKLGFILSDISRRYGVPFSYSSNFIPVAKRLSINKRNISLQKGLDELFAPTQIIYAVIGNSIALRIDASKTVLTKIEKPIERKQNISKTTVLFLERESYLMLVWERRIPQAALEKMKKWKPIEEKEEMAQESHFLDQELIQVTLVPPISTSEAPEKTTNTYSFNILWGRNGGLSGFEIGGGVNTILHNMRGFQLAGIGNHVKGDAQGGQLAAFFNYNEGFTRGIQASLVNIANSANVLQTAGIANIITEDFEGIQAALVGNYARTKADGIQASGLFNTTKGAANMQFSLGINKAGTINKLQIGLVNISTYTKGKQIGIINVSGASEQAPIGLLNLVKGGYNKIEVGASEALYATVGLKLGTRKFYNIFQFGSRFTEETWSIGYGLGTAFPLKERQFFHIEWVASHVNEDEIWTKELNLLNQLKFNFDWKLKGKGSLFLGPTWNILASRRKNTETQEIIGSNLPDYTILDVTKNNTNWKIWFGLSGGIRF